MVVIREVAAAAEVLRRGGLLAYPTETFYGLGALATHRAALARLAAAKGRPEGKALPLVAAARDQLEGIVARMTPAAERLAVRLWPGPLTLVLPAVPGLPPQITEDGTVAVRVPGSALARDLARLAGGALVSTSANFSGGRAPARAEELEPLLADRIDAVLDGGPTPGGLPSTVVALEAGGPRLLRPGAVSWEEILAVVGLPRGLPSTRD